jgi:hypothetical protein
MANCCKYIIKNIGTSVATFNFQKCDDAIWYYQEEILPNETKEIWCYKSSFSSSFNTVKVLSIDCDLIPPTRGPLPTPTPTPLPTICFTYYDVIGQSLLNPNRIITRTINANSLYGGHYYWILPTTYSDTYVYFDNTLNQWIWSQTTPSPSVLPLNYISNPTNLNLPLGVWSNVTLSSIQGTCPLPTPTRTPNPTTTNTPSYTPTITPDLYKTFRIFLATPITSNDVPVPIRFEIRSSTVFSMRIDWDDNITTNYNGNSTYFPSHIYNFGLGTTVIVVTLSYIENVNYLDFSFSTNNTYNYIGEIFGLSQMLSLQYLDMSDNIARYIPTDLPNSLLYLYANNNYLYHTPGQLNSTVFPPLLYDLGLSNNSIINFNPTTPLPTGLTRLSLNNNSIIEFNPTLPLPGTLNYLNLSFNLLSNFNPSLPLPSSLESLYLNNNVINYFNPSQPFPTSLKTLLLNNNQISYFQPNSFLPQVLNNLNLSNNSFTTNDVNYTLAYMSSLVWTNPGTINITTASGTNPPSYIHPNGVASKNLLTNIGWNVLTDEIITLTPTVTSTPTPTTSETPTPTPTVTPTF